MYLLLIDNKFHILSRKFTNKHNCIYNYWVGIWDVYVKLSIVHEGAPIKKKRKEKNPHNMDDQLIPIQFH